ncbi:MAG: diguanylate cyclase [Planctomycetota bacterium]
MRGSGLTTGLGVGVALTVAYWVAGALGLSLARVHPSASSVWPASGIAIGAIVVFGYRFWPAVFVGAFLVNVVAPGNVATALGIALGNTLECLAAAWLTHRFAGGLRAFERPRSFFAFLVHAAIGSTMISATIGVSSLALGARLPWADFGPVWVTWWLGDGIGALVVTPLLVVWRQSRVLWTRARVLEAGILVLGLMLVSWISFGSAPWGHRAYPLAFLPTPVLLWAGLRFTVREAAMANLVLGALAIGFTLRGDGPFAVLGDRDSLLMLQIFLGFMSGVALAVAVVTQESRTHATALLESRVSLERRVVDRTARLTEANAVLAAEISERTHAQKALAESEARFRHLVESAPDAVVIVGGDGSIQIVNAQTEKFFGYERKDLLGKPVEILLPERYRESHIGDRASYSANPRVRTMGEGRELFGRRSDGSEFPVDVSLSPLPAEHGQLISVAIRDVTRRKQAEAERLANESLRSQVAELSRRTVEIATLNRMSDMLRAVMSPEEVYPLVAPFLEELFPGDAGTLYAFGSSPTLLDVVARWGKAPIGEPVMKIEQCWALRRGTVYWLQHATPETACLHLTDRSTTASLCIPMAARGETLGLFHLHRAPASAVVRLDSGAASAERLDYWRKLAQAAAEQIAGALASAKLHAKLRAEAIRDPLTGLLNRRSFEESLDHEVHRATRRKAQVGVLMIDIDHFKLFNDRFGHAAGDFVLRQLAGLLLQSTRREDFVCRFGGEEIAVVMVECTRVDLLRRAQQILDGARGLSLSYDGRPLGSITLSIGAAVLPEHGSSPQELLEAADAALYRAKGEGRNRIALANRLAKGTAGSERRSAEGS